jgi:transposase
MPASTWSEIDECIAAPRPKMTDRAGNWATFAVGQNDRIVNEIAVRLGCDWHSVYDAVLAFGTALVEHLERIGDVTPSDSTCTSWASGERRTAPFLTALVDVERSLLIDIVPD